MVSSGLEAIRQSLVDALEAVSRSSEVIYHQMSASFPEMVRELESGIGSGGGSTQTVHRTLEDTLTAARSTLGTHEGGFAQAHDESERMLSKLDDQLMSLGQLGQSIEAIREDSTLMELISLNAMVIAVKAGESGRAFSTITSELKQLSNETMTLTDLIADGEGRLGRVFGDFKSDLQNLNQREQENFSGFLAGIRAALEGLSSGAAHLVQGIEAIRGKTATVKAPLESGLAVLQDSSRLRQSLRESLAALEGFHLAGDGAPWEQKLDELCFLEALADFGRQSLEHIGRQIQSDRDGLQVLLAQARTHLEELEDARMTLLKDHLNSEDAGTLEQWFQTGEALIGAFVVQTPALIRHREAAYAKRKPLQKNVSSLVDRLRSFDGLLAKFRNIDLASRVQVARQKALHTMRDNANEMTSLTRKIETDVRDAVKITSGFFKTVQALFAAYGEQFSHRLQQDQQFNFILLEDLRALRESKVHLARNVQDDRIFTFTFTSLFERTETDLLTLEDLVTRIGRQGSDLRELQARVGTEKASLLAENGLSSWSIGSENLKALLFQLEGKKKSTTATFDQNAP